MQGILLDADVIIDVLAGDYVSAARAFHQIDPLTHAAIMHGSGSNKDKLKQLAKAKAPDEQPFSQYHDFRRAPERIAALEKIVYRGSTTAGWDHYLRLLDRVFDGRFQTLPVIVKYDAKIRGALALRPGQSLSVLHDLADLEFLDVFWRARLDDESRDLALGRLLGVGSSEAC